MSRARARTRTRTRDGLSRVGGSDHIGHGHGYGPCDNADGINKNTPERPLHPRRACVTVPFLLRKAEVCSFLL